MDDPVAAERENLRFGLALLSRLRANVQPDQIAVRECDLMMRELYARLEELGFAQDKLSAP